MPPAAHTRQLRTLQPNPACTLPRLPVALPRDVYQFIVLTLAARSGIAFEWQDHVAAARAAGVPEGVVAGIKAGSANLEAPFDVVQQVIDCATAYRSIPAPLQATAIDRFGLHGLIEIVTLCGFYALIGMVNTCFDVALPQSPGPLST